MAVKLANPNKAKPKTYSLLQLLLFLGPMHLLAGLHLGIDDVLRRHDTLSSSAEWFNFSVALAGMSMLVYGLGLLKIRQDRIEKRLDELERLKS